MADPQPQPPGPDPNQSGPPEPPEDLFAPRVFDAFLTWSLILTIDGTATTVRKGQIESIDLRLASWGFDCELTFWISSLRTADDLFATFKTQKLIQAALKVAPTTEDDAPAPAAETIEITGFVTEKQVREQTISATEDRAVQFRRYTIKFSDAARVLWKQHRPNDLFIDKKLQDVIDAHKGDKITITCTDWSVTQTVHPIHFLGLGANPKGASFYDFLIWFVDTQNGVLTYDAVAKSYKLATEKLATGTPGKLQPIEVQSIRHDFPATPRMNLNVQNSDSASASTTAITNAEVATGMRQDFLIRTTIAQQKTDRVTLETARLILREPEVFVEFCAWPSTGFLPGTLLDFSHSDFGTSIFGATKTYRSREVHFKARAAGDARLERASAAQGMKVNLEILLEKKEETFVALPEYVEPEWPVAIEALVVSEQGADDEETYNLYTDSNTSVDQYKVKVPLWENKIVVAPYEPTNFTSHVYFPLIKNERVLVQMGFRSARIERTLDWRPGARIPMDGQGDNIVLGKKALDQTTITHNYVDALPVLTVKRIKEKDTEILVMQDGKILLRTKEDP